MKNHEKMNSMSLYDLLIQINDGMIRQQNENFVSVCVLDALCENGIANNIRCEDSGKEKCAACISAWLNEKAKTTDEEQPVKCGKWIVSSDGYYPYCSECGDRPPKITNYCANCGTKMEVFRNE